jgi:hypothetical protein
MSKEFVDQLAKEIREKKHTDSVLATILFKNQASAKKVKPSSDESSNDFLRALKAQKKLPVLEALLGTILAMFTSLIWLEHLATFIVNKYPPADEEDTEDEEDVVELKPATAGVKTKLEVLYNGFKKATASFQQAEEMVVRLHRVALGAQAALTHARAGLESAREDLAEAETQYAMAMTEEVNDDDGPAAKHPRRQ